MPTSRLLHTLAISLLLSITACDQGNNSESKQHQHEHENEHEHDHQHGTTTEQVIPADYQVNFVVSNHPLFLLSEAVTKGTPTTVRKLLKSGDVGHHGGLSPSDIRAIKDSKHVVWFGSSLESNLAKTLKAEANTNDQSTKVISILDNDKITLLNHRDVQAKAIADSPDPHVWLDPDNAKVIVNLLADLHAKTNPKYAEIYHDNAQKFAKELDKQVASYQSSIEARKQNKYWGSHDAFQYLEKSLAIELAGTLTTDHEIPTKASQIVWLKNNRPYATMCLLSQSQLKSGVEDKLKPVISKVMVEDLSDSDTYLQAWQNSAQKVNECLQGSANE